MMRALVLLLCAAPLGATAWAAGDPAAGEALIITCQACHGRDGKATAPLYPSIGGQNERYLLRQLEMIQSGERPAPLMAGQLNGKSAQDLENMAAYYAAQPAAEGVAAGDDEQVALAQRLYRGGSLEKGVAACTACHAPNGAGNAPAGFPRINGQVPEYTVAQLTAYREGRRTTDEEYGGMMRAVAGGLTDTENAALADYLQGLR